MTDPETRSWWSLPADDLWIFDKLLTARRLGYRCGPSGIDVPHAGEYVVRPAVNVLGMGRGAQVRYLADSTDHLPVGTFWCERFVGEHLSVDYAAGEPVLTVRGVREPTAPLWRWSWWERVTDGGLPLPGAIADLAAHWPRLNVEYVGGRAIEVHPRWNASFHDAGYTVAVPVWSDETHEQAAARYGAPLAAMRYLPDPDWQRTGFLVR